MSADLRLRVCPEAVHPLLLYSAVQWVNHTVPGNYVRVPTMLCHEAMVASSKLGVAIYLTNSFD